MPNSLHPPLAGGELYAQSPIPLANGTFTPDEAWNTPREGSDDWLDAVPGLSTDARGHV